MKHNLRNITVISAGALGSRIAILRERRKDEDVWQAKDRLHFSMQQDEAVSGAGFIIEAAVEGLSTKRGIFSNLDQTAPAHAILAINSSNIMPSQIAGVEVVPHAGTSQRNDGCHHCGHQSLGDIDRAAEVHSVTPWAHGRKTDHGWYDYST